MNRPDSARGWSLLETLFAVVVLGIAVTVFMRIQSRTSGLANSNANMQKASHMIEQHIESMRTQIAENPLVYWPPRDTAYADPATTYLILTRKVSPAQSPKDVANLPTVRTINLTVAWGPRALDTIKVTTYVSKNF